MSKFQKLGKQGRGRWLGEGGAFRKSILGGEVPRKTSWARLARTDPGSGEGGKEVKRSTQFMVLLYIDEGDELVKADEGDIDWGGLRVEG